MKTELHPVLGSIAAGSLSGTISTLLFQPLDLIKTRLQQVSHAHAQPPPQCCPQPQSLLIRSPGFMWREQRSVIVAILRTENPLKLWRGLKPSLARCVPGVGVYFGCYHWLKRNVCGVEGEVGGSQALFIGVTARALSALLLIPLTVLKTRFESPAAYPDYLTIRASLASIYKSEGVRGLCCGVVPTLLRDAPFSGLYLFFYTAAKRAVPSELLENSNNGRSSLVRFSCGLVAGVAASMATQPADVLKTKMQLYPTQFPNMGQAALFVWERYGAFGFFRGFVPRALRRSLMAAMSWTVYEHLTKAFGIK